MPIDQAEHNNLRARFSWGRAAISGFLSKFGDRHGFPCIFGYRWVRRDMPEPCVPGCGSVKIDRGTKTLSVGSHGQVMLGHSETLRSSFRKIHSLMGWRQVTSHARCVPTRHRCPFIRAVLTVTGRRGGETFSNVFQRCPPYNSSQSPSWRKSCQKISMPVPC